MTELIDAVAEVVRRLGFASDQIEEVQEFVKFVINIFFSVMENILS